MYVRPRLSLQSSNEREQSAASERKIAGGTRGRERGRRGRGVGHGSPVCTVSGRAGLVERERLSRSADIGFPAHDPLTVTGRVWVWVEPRWSTTAPRRASVGHGRGEHVRRPSVLCIALCYPVPPCAALHARLAPKTPPRLSDRTTGRASPTRTRPVQQEGFGRGNGPLPRLTHFAVPTMHGTGRLCTELCTALCTERRAQAKPKQCSVYAETNGHVARTVTAALTMMTKH